MFGEPIEHTRLHQASDDDKESSMHHYRFATETCHTFFLSYDTRNQQYRQGAQKSHLGRYVRASHHHKDADHRHDSNPGVDTQSEYIPVAKYLHHQPF